MTAPGQLFAVAGPSGVGKSTVVKSATASRDDLWLSISATTRAPRAGERDGVDYQFLSRPGFEQLRDNDGFLEWAEFAGNLYGTPRAAVLEHTQAGRHVVLEIDVHGVRQVRHAWPGAVTVFISPPSREDLVARLIGRGTEPEDVIARRLTIADQELAAQPEFDHVIVNRQVTQAVADLLGLIDGRAAERVT